jgi:predicted SprT family Zn-dependent metalloprotease
MLREPCSAKPPKTCKHTSGNDQATNVRSCASAKRYSLARGSRTRHELSSTPTPFESLPPATARAVGRWLRQWGRKWAYPGLPGDVSIAISQRLRRSWGRSSARTRRISLSPDLLAQPKALQEVLCHEAAHLVAATRAGRTEGPHGEPWKNLVRLAGFVPVSNRDTDALPNRAKRRAAFVHRCDVCGFTRRAAFVHRCDVCGFTRRAGRPVTRWRCADCIAAGLDGRLTIIRVAVRA